MPNDAIDRLLDAVAWEAVDPPPAADDGLPCATHEGRLSIGGVELMVYQLSDGRRVIEQDALLAFLASMSGPDVPPGGGEGG